ncbi:MAG: transcription-repair coupling factor [Acidobacteria bacterium]|nr:transcription-repair coupling factor [Acidobacteriota bacterium]
MNPWNYLGELLHHRLTLHRAGQLHVRGCTDAARPLAAAVIAAEIQTPLVCLLPNNEEADRFRGEFVWHLAQAGRHVSPVLFPDLEISPYQGLSPHPQILEQRCLALWQLLAGDGHCLITTPSALLERLPAPDTFVGWLTDLRVAREFPLEQLRRLLPQLGYSLEDPVTEVGEYSVRGGILDVFSPNHPYPLRLEWFGPVVDSIRYFDPDTQRSVRQLDQAGIIPITHYVVPDQVLAELQVTLDREFSTGEDSPRAAEIREQLAAGVLPSGGQFLLPLVTTYPASLLDYLTAPPVLLELECRLRPSWEAVHERQQVRYEEASDQGSPGLPPAAHFFTAADQEARLAALRHVCIADFTEEETDSIRLPTTPTTSFLGNFTGLIRHLSTSREHVLFVLSSSGRCQRIHELCEEYGIRHRWQEEFQWSQLELAGQRQIVITRGPLVQGFRLPELSLAVFGSDDIFPRTRPRRKPTAGAKASSVSAFISSFRDLRTGDHVVHLDHGIGVFRGLNKLQVGGLEQEFAALEYAQGDKLFVPAERLDLIQKFSGSEGIRPPLDKLGGVTWQKTRSKVKKALRDMAEELLKVAAQRQTTAGFRYPPDDQWQREFESMFEYEETPDQLSALSDIKRDLESERSMDRLLCGDVGYGKTEVAIRAVFKAVAAGKQAAVLAPTTVLAFQHYNTFRNRFSSFPVRIELLSRFRSAAQNRQTIAALQTGQADIVVGTHRLLSRDVAFHDLGLLIVDEEQRFGVTHKERIKKLRAEVDVLTLTATPIPRTLYMSITGIRDISVIETPPKDRLAIQTEVVRFNSDIIRDAIHREMARQGQVYFVHNRIENIHEMAAYLHELVPGVRIAVAHGQMREAELERIITRFIQQEFDILLSTTIIENGIDIPLVNTIIINNAHRFGLAQLYQLRGRVGRSNRRAFAWLLVPSLDALTDTARKRLAAIRDFSELGAGFRLAALDLEIRGAGNILGAEQHGHINAVGFETYCRLMEETVREMRGETYIPPEKINLNLQVRLRIPESYVPLEAQRLHLYKKIASAGDEDELARLREEIRDRHGQFPEMVDHLFEYSRLRLLAMELKILSIERKKNRFRIQFTPDSPVDTARLIEKIRRNESWSFTPAGMLTMDLPFTSTGEMFQNVKKSLVELVSHDRI